MNPPPPSPVRKNLHQFAPRKSSKAWHKRDARLGSKGPKSLLKQQTTAATLILKGNVSSKVSFIIDGLFGLLLLPSNFVRGGRNDVPIQVPKTQPI